LYQIIFSPLAFKQFKKLPKEVQERVILGLKRIRINPEKYIKKLVGYDKLFRLRIGTYRVILELKDNDLVIHILKIGLRKNIYKRL